MRATASLKDPYKHLKASGSIWSLTEFCGGQDRSCMILYLTGNEHFLVTLPIGDLTKSEKEGWVNGPALHPAATLLERYSMMTSGWSKADFQLSETMLILSPSKPMFTPCLVPWSSLEHHTWSGSLVRYLWKLLRCSGDCATKTTSGSRVLLLTVATDMCSFTVGKCAAVQLEVITALSPIVEPSIQLCRWGGFGWTWFRCLPHSHALLHNLCHCQWGSLGKGTPIYQMIDPPHLKHLWAEVLTMVALRIVTIRVWSIVVKGSCGGCTLHRT